MAHVGALPVSLIPKVELHRHLEGSVRFETAWQWAQRSPTLTGISREELRDRIQFDGVVGYDRFLKKFETLRQLYYDPAAIAQVMREAVEDAAHDHVRYLELRLSPDHFAKQAGFDFYETAELLFQTGQVAAHAMGIQVRYLCTITRNYSPETCERILDIALRYRDWGVVGFDLAGNEFLETGDHVRALLKRASMEGLGISVHAGEAGSPEPVWTAIDTLYATRIAHGVASVQEPALMRELQERKILLEVCPTSNLHTGATASASVHPLRELVKAGIRVSVGTDDPSISRITLSDEYAFAVEVAGLTYPQLYDSILDGAHGTFLPDAEKADLVARLSEELSQLTLDSE
jgi:adenosine deaminase